MLSSVLRSERAVEVNIAIMRTFVQLGNASAMVQLGFAYRDGVGVQADPDEAAEWVNQLLETAREGSEFHRDGQKLRDAMNSELL